ncbi:MAG: phage holin family protein [Eggerthellaceae bacterium]|jgi:putative membrane protein|nr:phage holin family protein [Eggerthellaceae bacterium]MDR2715182.1 phage holin family protein [Coriobacteriaceae bacterium]
MKLVIRYLATAVAVVAAIWIVPGIEILGGLEDWGAIALFSLILALANMVVKPILKVLSFPITVLTLGLFLLVINAAMLYLASWVASNVFQVEFIIENFGSALLAGLVISIIVSVINAATGANK